MEPWCHEGENGELWIEWIRDPEWRFHIVIENDGSACWGLIHSKCDNPLENYGEIPKEMMQRIVDHWSKANAS